MPYSKWIIILLFELGFGIKLNLIGVISVSELFLLIFVPLFVLPKVKWNEAVGVKQVTMAYSALLGFQILSEFMVGNNSSSALKGIAITVVSYLHFMFLIYYLARLKLLILVLVVAQMARAVVFGTDIEEQSIEDVMSGEGATYLKFYISPIVISFSLAMSMIFKYKNFALLHSLLGIVLIVLGSRSSGGIALATGLVTYMFEHRVLTYNKKFIVMSLVLGCMIGYAFYVYYVNRVLYGEITSGNSRQVFLCSNPYNPLELLMAGRSEVWIGWQAFMDNFWFGHGAWAYDSTGRYQRMMIALHGELSTFTRSQVSYHFLIPSHSVLIGSGMMNGVFAFLSMGVIVVYFLRKGVLSFIHCDDRYKLVLVNSVISLFWTAMFSPQSHFRLTMPVAFAIIFVLSASVENIKTVEVRRSMAVRYAAFRAVKDRVLPRKTRHIGD
jgi:hypothetical protein